MAVILLVVYLVMMVGIGVWGMRKTANLNDFFLGGRTIGPWISAFAYGTTYFSAVIFIGFGGKVGWTFGLKGLWIAAGNVIIGSLLAWLVLGARTWRMTKNLDVMTMPEFLSERYNAKVLKGVAATIIFVFLLPYSASVFKGLSHLFEATFHMPYDMALLIMIGVTGIYLILGGYFAVTLTDFIQGIIMLGGAGAMVAVIIAKTGGLGATINGIITNYAAHVPADKQPGWLAMFSLVFMTSFGVWGMPQMVQKFYAIRDKSVIKKAAIVTTLFAAVITFAAYFVGATTHLFYDKLPLLPSGKPDFDRLIPDLLISHLPGGLMAVILILILSASMSTLSSLILVSASSVAIDLYKGHVNPKVSKESSLAMMRFLSAVFIAFSYIIARYQFSLIITLMSLSWGAVAGSFMAPYVYGLYWKRTTLAGAVAGMVTGFTLSIVLFFSMGPSNAPLASTIAMLVPFAVIPIVSWVSKPPSHELLQKAFKEIA